MSQLATTRRDELHRAMDQFVCLRHPFVPGPSFCLASILKSNNYISRPYEHKHRMQILSKLAHTPAAKAKRAQTMRRNSVNNTATEKERGRLRDKSINPSGRVDYTGTKRNRSTEPSASPPPKKRKIEPAPKTRLEALHKRLAHRHPSRFDVKEWKNYKLESLSRLHSWYPNSTSPLSCHLSPF